MTGEKRALSRVNGIEVLNRRTYHENVDGRKELPYKLAMTKEDEKQVRRLSLPRIRKRALKVACLLPIFFRLPANSPALLLHSRVGRCRGSTWRGWLWKEWHWKDDREACSAER